MTPKRKELLANLMLLLPAVADLEKAMKGLPAWNDELEDLRIDLEGFAKGLHQGLRDYIYLVTPQDYGPPTFDN